MSWCLSCKKNPNSQHLTATTCLCSWWCRSYDRGVKTSSTPHHYNFLVLLLLQKLGVWLSCQNPKLLNTWSPLVTCTSAAEARTQLSKPYTFNNSPPQLTCASGAAEAMTEASKPQTPEHHHLLVLLVLQKLAVSTGEHFALLTEQCQLLLRVNTAQHAHFRRAHPTTWKQKHG